MFRRNLRIEESHESTGGSVAHNLAAMHSARASWMRGPADGGSSAGLGGGRGGSDAPDDLYNPSKWTKPSWTPNQGSGGYSGPDDPLHDLLFEASGLLPMPSPVAPSSGEVRMILLRRTLMMEEERLHHFQEQQAEQSGAEGAQEQAPSGQAAQTQEEQAGTNADPAEATPAAEEATDAADKAGAAATPEAAPDNAAAESQDPPAESAPDSSQEERQETRLVLPVLESLITLRRERMSALAAAAPTPPPQPPQQPAAAPIANTPARSLTSKPSLRRATSNLGVRSSAAAAAAAGAAAAAAAAPTASSPTALSPVSSLVPTTSVPRPGASAAVSQSSLAPSPPRPSPPQPSPQQLPPQPSLGQFPGPWRASRKWSTMGDMLADPDQPSNGGGNPNGAGAAAPAAASSTTSRDGTVRLRPNGAKDIRPQHTSQSFTFGTGAAAAASASAIAAAAAASSSVTTAGSVSSSTMPHPPASTAAVNANGGGGVASSPRSKRFTSMRTPKQREGPKAASSFDSADVASGDEPSPKRAASLLQRFHNWRLQRRDLPPASLLADEEDEEDEEPPQRLTGGLVTMNSNLRGSHLYSRAATSLNGTTMYGSSSGGSGSSNLHRAATGLNSGTGGITSVSGGVVDSAERPAIGPLAMPLWLGKGRSGGTSTGSGEETGQSPVTSLAGGVSSRSNSFLAKMPSFRTRQQSISTGQVFLPTEWGPGKAAGDQGMAATVSATGATGGGPAVGTSALVGIPDGRGSPGGLAGPTPPVFSYNGRGGTGDGSAGVGGGAGNPAPGVLSGMRVTGNGGGGGSSGGGGAGSRLANGALSFAGEIPRGSTATSPKPHQATSATPTRSMAEARQSMARGRFTSDVHAHARSPVSPQTPLHSHPQTHLQGALLAMRFSGGQGQGGLQPQEPPPLMVTNTKRGGLDGAWQGMPPGLLPMVKTSQS